MAENPAVVLVKRFTYRGTAEEWSNKYHFVETPPSTPTGWKTLVDGLSAIEKQVYTASVHVVRAYCYTDGSLDSVYTVDYTALGAEIAGTLTTGTGTVMSGDQATWIRWATAKRNTKGKTVYLRKYYHGGMLASPGGDALLTAYITALQAAGVALAGGTGHFTGFTICGPDGTAAGTSGISPWVTTRTLKRRGKRPPT
jgi:hypothetical protein